MSKKKRTPQKPKSASTSERGAAALAHQTYGRKTKFSNRKKNFFRLWCRRSVDRSDT